MFNVDSKRLFILVAGGLLLYSGVGSAATYTCNSCSDCNTKLGSASFGDTVYLTADIINHSGNCIEFNANNVEFDCQDHTIDGDDSGNGIYIYGKAGNTIKNCVVNDYQRGIYVESASNITITSNNGSSNAWNGIYLKDVQDSTISSNTLESNDDGIYLDSSQGNTISDNILRSNGYAGILLMSSSNNTMNSNQVCSNTEYDFYLYESTGNFGTGNYCDNPGDWNDEGTTGCSYSCGAVTTTTTTSTTSTTSTTLTTSTTTSTTTTTTTLDWSPVLIVGSGRGYNEGEFYEPVDVAVDSNGSIYVLERENARIQEFDLDGSFLESFGEEGDTGLGEFDGPSGLAIREVEENITQFFIADTDNHRVQVMKQELVLAEDNSTEVNITWMAFGERCYTDCKPWVYIYFEKPGGVDVDDDGRIYVADTGYDRISVFDSPGLDEVPTSNDRTDYEGFDEPEGVSVCGDRIYVADTGNDSVRVLNLSGSGLISITGFSKPHSTAEDSEGNVYVADSLNSRIVVYNPDGLYVTEFGEENCSTKIYSNPEEAAGQFCKPEGIEVWGDRVYVADTWNHRVQVFVIPKLPPATCPLQGDIPPCGEVTLSEVVDFINLWVTGEAELTDVIALINAWAFG